MFETGLFNFDNNIFKIEQINTIINSNSFPIDFKEKITVTTWPADNNKKIKLTFSGKSIIKFGNGETKEFFIIFQYDLDQTTWNSINTTP